MWVSEDRNTYTDIYIDRDRDIGAESRERERDRRGKSKGSGSGTRGLPPTSSVLTQY